MTAKRLFFRAVSTEQATEGADMDDLFRFCDHRHNLWRFPVSEPQDPGVRDVFADVEHRETAVRGLAATQPSRGDR